MINNWIATHLLSQWTGQVPKVKHMPSSAACSQQKNHTMPLQRGITTHTQRHHVVIHHAQHTDQYRLLLLDAQDWWYIHSTSRPASPAPDPCPSHPAAHPHPHSPYFQTDLYVWVSMETAKTARPKAFRKGRLPAVAKVQQGDFFIFRQPLYKVLLSSCSTRGRR